MWSGVAQVGEHQSGNIFWIRALIHRVSRNPAYVINAQTKHPFHRPSRQSNQPKNRPVPLQDQPPRTLRAQSLNLSIKSFDHTIELDIAQLLAFRLRIALCCYSIAVTEQPSDGFFRDLTTIGG
jgi:hypothetical protein